MSIEINLTLDLIKYNRYTYSLLDWFRDLGGLFLTLFWIGKLFSMPFSQYFLNRALMASFFRFKDNSQTLDNYDSDDENNKAFRATVKID